MSGGLILVRTCLTVMVVGLPAGPHVYLLRVVVVGQLVQVVVDRLEHQVSRDLFRPARVNIIYLAIFEFLVQVCLSCHKTSYDWWTCTGS